MENKKKILIISAVAIFIILAFFSALSENHEQNITQENTQPEENIQQEQTAEFITNYKWNTNETKQYKNYYYVNAGIEEEPIIQKYVELRVEKQPGDLEAGKYKFETSNTAGASFTVFISNEPIEDFNTTEIKEELITPDIPYEVTIEKGQYVYILQGFTNKGTAEMTKIE